MTNFIKITNFIRFFKDLHLPRTIKNMQYAYRGKAIVYALKCEANMMVYIGSTIVPGRRFHNHLVTGRGSNELLQAAIKEHGLENFTAYILEVIDFPNDMTHEDKIKLLRNTEQKHINLYPKKQLYNLIASSQSYNPLFTKNDIPMNPTGSRGSADQ